MVLLSSAPATCGRSGPPDISNLDEGFGWNLIANCQVFLISPTSDRTPVHRISQDGSDLVHQNSSSESDRKAFRRRELKES